MPLDLVLSSGFLAFARQAGFLEAVEQADLPVGAVMGTSSGALAGALWCAGYSARDTLAHLTQRAPIHLVGLSWAPWRGVLTLDPAIALLSDLLPPTFADLERPFAVGVEGPDGRHQLVHEGPLAPAVAASCAMPGVFVPVDLPIGRCRDGGAVDRLGLAAHRTWRGAVPTVAHWVDRSAGKDVPVDLDDPQLTVVRTPRSGAMFWNLGDVEGQREEARQLAAAALSARAS